LLDLALDILDCRYGKMLIFSADQVIGKSLRMYGEWAQHELSFLYPYVVPDTIVADIGANIGTHTLAFSKWLGNGQVIACEPQELVANVLTINCLLNHRSNVQVLTALCGPRGARLTDVRTDPDNVGAAQFKISSSLSRRIENVFRRLCRCSSGTPVLALDDIVKGRRVSLIKIDAEGMEFEILRGAEETLRRSSPTVYFEQNDTDKLSAIHDLLDRQNYRLYWLETHPFNKDNFRTELSNIWWRTESGILALPNSEPERRDLMRVKREDREIPRSLNAREGICVAPSD
jgi:FkbM family methyltransferase